MTSCGTFQKLRPLSLLTHLSNSYDSAHLKVVSNSVAWSIYLENGKITYASHSVEPFDRLDCHLRRLASRMPSLSSETRAKLRLMFENDLSGEQLNINSEYQAICWLIERQHLTEDQAKILIEGLVKEVIESFLLVEQGSYELHSFPETTSYLTKLDLSSLVKYAQKQLQAWQSLAPELSSPYQCPYLASSSLNQKLTSELRQKLTAILKGFSFRHLAILLNQDELRLAQSLYPYIKAGNILLQPPSAPFDCLPSFVKSAKEPTKNYLLPLEITANKSVTAILAPSSPELPEISPPNPPRVNIVVEPINNLPETQTNKKTYKIVCVDDSPAMLREISYFLDDESFAVSTISDPIKALMQIVRLKPDLILLDVKMAGIDGYELCRLLRNHSFFKTTPIIMVTGNTGIIDRVKAKMVGASGYLTKPFAQADLLKIVFRHLS
ncbi:response regulator [Chlorogloea sp. CCALA 695]|uniref:response regulator n=1 Tax=Chlorogloea sp. CCALA 695 TaxID=2107693 RepID=UPI000D048F26|nr:response regulator [Chlorogloea sp. CCALA 695]PSB30965.1 two-component system response regulator [Chlorogloea sp. CCALA 695]